MINVIIQKHASGNNYSLESGIADNVRNFDHHKPEHRHFPSPSNNKEIPIITEGTIEISHMDADTFIGLLRFFGKDVPNIDLDLVERIDLNGSSVVEDPYDRTLLYMVGIGQMRYVPRCGEEPQQVNAAIETMMNFTTEEIIEIGRKATDASEEAYKNCRLAFVPGVGIYIVGEKDEFDPSRPYKDGIGIVVVYRNHYKSISIYADPTSSFEAAGKTWGGVEFAGHPKACGSPRGLIMTPEQAMSVWSDIAVKMGQF